MKRGEEGEREREKRRNAQDSECYRLAYNRVNSVHSFVQLKVTIIIGLLTQHKLAKVVIFRTVD